MGSLFDHAAIMDFISWAWGIINYHDITKILINLACAIGTVNIFIRLGKAIKKEDEDMQELTIGDDDQ